MNQITKRTFLKKGIIAICALICITIVAGLISTVLGSGTKIAYAVKTTNYSSKTTAELAKEILSRSNIKYTYTAKGAEPYAKNNLVDTSNGKNALKANGSRVALSKGLLISLLLLNDKYGGFGINCIANGWHSDNSNHYKGIAVDINSSPFGPYSSNGNHYEATDYLKSYGITFGDKGYVWQENAGHIHFSVKSFNGSTPTPTHGSDTSTGVTIPHTKPSASTNLKEGNKSCQVGWLQWSLNYLGYTLTVDEDFGPETKKQVKAFQKANGLTQDGIAGKNTLAKIVEKLKAKNSVTVTFKNWDNTVLKTQTVLKGQSATTPANPTRTGYTFSGWSGTYTNVQANSTVKATFSINKYTVKFINWDGTILKTETVEYGKNATPPANPKRTGYTFSSWSGTYTNISSSRDIKATFTINKYIVTFKDWDGTVLKTETVEYGKNATPPANPTRTGYTFVGWTNYKNITGNTTVTATFTPIAKPSLKEGTVLVGSINKAALGKTIEIPVELGINPGVIALSLSLNYSNENFELIDVKNGKIFSDEALTSVYLTASQPIIYFDASTLANNTKTGTLCVLVFKVKDTATAGNSEISLTYKEACNSSFEEVKFSTAAGRVIISSNSRIAGDADNDGQLTAKDISLLKQYYAGWDVEICNENCDLNVDGKISITEIAKIRQAYAGWYELEIG